MGLFVKCTFFRSLTLLPLQGEIYNKVGDIDYFFFVLEGIVSRRNGLIPAEVVLFQGDMFEPFPPSQGEIDKIQGDIDYFVFVLEGNR